MSDGRLLALVIAVGMLVMAATDAASVGMLMGVAVMTALVYRQRACGRRSADTLEAALTEIAPGLTTPDEDPLVARARALRERAASRF